MPILPDFDDFERGYEAGENQVVYQALAADLDTPVSLMLKLADADQNSFMLESVTGGEIRGRYSIVGMNPDLIWECQGDTARIDRTPALREDSWSEEPVDPLSSLRNLINESRIALPSSLPASSAGLFGYLGYDMARLAERLPNVNEDRIGTPDAVLIRPSVVAVLDGVKGDVTVVSPAWFGDGIPAEKAYASARSRVLKAVDRLEGSPGHSNRILGQTSFPATVQPGLAKEDFVSIVRKAKQYIGDGDIFQVVLSHRLNFEFNQSPISLYRALRRTNPSPFMFFFNFGEFQVIGASPEILVRVFDRTITIRPLAGSRPRGESPDEDARLGEELLADEKERAEHLMLLDLGRNDVGRVARTGTVRPTEVFAIERYSHVMHIVSNVEGELSAEHDALSALLAGLPAGTVSGAPKVRAMEIIDELEIEKRGVYGGGVGYFSANGDMDMCIALRTSVLKGNQLFVQAGAGIVHDSDPDTEWQETVNKAQALRNAAAEASMFAGDERTGRGNRSKGNGAN